MTDGLPDIEDCIKFVKEDSSDMNVLSHHELDSVPSPWTIFTTAETLQGCDDSQEWYAIGEDSLVEVEP